MIFKILLAFFCTALVQLKSFGLVDNNGDGVFKEYFKVSSNEVIYEEPNNFFNSSHDLHKRSYQGISQNSLITQDKTLDRWYKYTPRFVNSRVNSSSITSDAASFPHIDSGLNTSNQDGIRELLSMNVMHFEYEQTFAFLKKKIFRKTFLKASIKLNGTFGIFDKSRIQEYNLPFAGCMINNDYDFDLNNTSNYGIVGSLSRLYIYFKAPDSLDASFNDTEGSLLEMNWTVKGLFFSRFRQLAEFDFTVATTHHPYFYASNFQSTSTSKSITIEPIINPGKDITIIIRETISLPLLIGKIGTVVAAIILLLRLKILKRLTRCFSSN